tara:strand:+ start:284 stop:1057 length:774 start_codon:yes stop_codon:yes gene_type:complete
MKGVVIAAGMGQRLAPMTNDRPKCLVEMNGTNLLENLLRRFDAFGISPVTAVTGYCGEKITERVSFETFHNAEYRTNNCLHSWMKAREFFDEDLVASYSDIYIEDGPFEALIGIDADFAIAVDRSFLGAYEGRTDHPIAQCEMVFYDDDANVIKLGKNRTPEDEPGLNVGEFIGLFLIRKALIPAILEAFDELDRTLSPSEPWREATSWHNAYVTDFITELLARGITVKAALFDGGWAEVDTFQDFQRVSARFGNNG